MTGLVVALLGAMAQAAPCMAATRPTPSPPPVSGVAQGLSTSTPSFSERLAAALSQIHAYACEAAIRRTAEFLVEGQQANFVIQPLGPDANRWPLVVTLESLHPVAGRTRFSTIVAAPGPACSGMYQQTIYWPITCDKLRQTVFANFGAAHVILHDVQVSEANAGLQLYLLPGGAGCVSIKKELFR